jgi:hypothetical protein
MKQSGKAFYSAVSDPIVVLKNMAMSFYA